MFTKLLKPIDTILNQITMYRLVLYILLIMIAAASVWGAVGLVPFSPVAILGTTVVITMISVITNEVFARVYKAPVNIESVYITALIMVLIVSPITKAEDIWMVVWASVLAQASKYILAYKNKHIFNPAAIAVVATALAAGQSASWWVGNIWMSPLVIISTLLIARKLRREEMVEYFLMTAISVSLGMTMLRDGNLLNTLNNFLFHSSLFFLAGIMLTEPLTSPTRKRWQVVYGTVVGILFVPQVHVGKLYFTPELALVVGNMLAYLVSSKQKLVLELKEKIQISPDTFDFIFPLKHNLAYEPGQYMEWTIGDPKSDERGNRRYFTLASSPTEDNLRVGVKFAENSSSFKKDMLEWSGQKIVASQLAGDFVLPKDKYEKLVLVAGGIGVTPFRSMIKYLVDKNEKRDIIVLYSNREIKEIVYKDVFCEAEKKLGVKTIYTLTEGEKIPSDWRGEKGRINQTLIERNIPDWKERTYYISGPQMMVMAIKEELEKAGLPKGKIKTDYFPGFV